MLHRMATVTPGGTRDQCHGDELVSARSVWGGLVCFSLKADFSGSAATEAGSSKSIVSGLLCLGQRLCCAGTQHSAQSSGCFQPIYFYLYLSKSGMAAGE